MAVLVGYASAHGSTAQITRRIADVLQRQGWAVEVAAVQDIHDPGGCAQPDGPRRTAGRSVRCGTS